MPNLGGSSATQAWLAARCLPCGMSRCVNALPPKPVTCGVPLKACGQLANRLTDHACLPAVCPISQPQGDLRRSVLLALQRLIWVLPVEPTTWCTEPAALPLAEEVKATAQAMKTALVELHSPQLGAPRQQGWGSLLAAAPELGARLLDCYRHRDAAEWQLQQAQAAAQRSCAYLRCANAALQGGPAAGQGEGTLRCSSCRVAWYW